MRLPAFTQLPRRPAAAGPILIALALLLAGLALLFDAGPAEAQRDFYAATVSGGLLTVYFNDHLRPVNPGSSPHPSAFVVQATPPGGTTRTVSGFGQTVAVSGTSVTVGLDVTNPVLEGETLTVSYTKPATNPLKYKDGQDVSSFAGKRATNNTDNTKPNVIAAELNGTELILYFDDRLKASAVPGITSFNLQLRGSLAVPVGNPSIVGSNALRIPAFSAANPAKHDETVRFAYTPPSNAANRIQDRSGNQLDAIAQWADIDNQTPPVLSSAAVVGATLVLTFDGALDEDPEQVPPGRAFTVRRTRSGTATNVGLIATNPVAVKGRDVVLSLAEAVLRTDTVTVAYNDPNDPGGGGRLRDADKREHPVRDFPAKTVTNATLATTAPQFSSAAVNGNSLTVTFNETLQTTSSHTPPNSAFAVSAMPLYGTARTISGDSGNVTISGNTVTVTLASEVERGERVAVSYTKPSANVLRGTDNNDVASFGGGPATNNSPGSPAPSFSGASYSYPRGGITVHFDGPFLGCADRNAWIINVDGTQTRPQSARCEDRAVLLVLAALTDRPRVEAARGVTVSYNRWIAELEERSKPLFHPPRGSRGPSAQAQGHRRQRRSELQRPAGDRAEAPAGPPSDGGRVDADPDLR